MPRIDIPGRGALLRQDMTLENLYKVTISDGDLVACRWLEGDQEMALTFSEYNEMVMDFAAYLRRAVVAMIGLGANPPEDAVYPLLVADDDGQPVTGEHCYVLHFDSGALPPVDAFWSVTMYDAEGYQVANELGRFAIGDRDALAFNTSAPRQRKSTAAAARLRRREISRRGPRRPIP